MPLNVTSIGACAFFGNDMTTFTLNKNINEVDGNAFADCQNLAQINVNAENDSYVSHNGILYGKDGTCLYAYPAGKQGDTYSIREGTKSTAKYAFFGSNLRTINVPSGLEAICEYSFANCQNVESIELPGSVYSIYDFAFYESDALSSITLLSVVDTIIGYCSFDNNADGRKINVTRKAYEYYEVKSKIEQYMDDLVVLVATINFDAKSGEEAESMTVNVGDGVDFEETERVGYNFEGWYYDESGESRVGSGSSVAAWTKLGATTLYAKWHAIEYSVIYVINQPLGKAGLEYPQTGSFTVEDAFVLPTPKCDGYTFAGWYKTSDFSGVTVAAINKGAVGNVTLYAKWAAISYSVTLNPNYDGATVTNGLTVVFDEAYVIPDAEREGYVFCGWFANAEGTGEIYNGVKWNVADDVELFAKWTKKTFKVKIVYQKDNGTVTMWWGANGIQQYETAVSYGDSMDETFRNVCIDYFSSYEYVPGKYCAQFTAYPDVRFGDGSWDSIPDLGEDGQIIEVCPQWENKTYNIEFFNGGSKISTVSGSFGGAITYPTPNEVGFAFVNWQIIGVPSGVSVDAAYSSGKVFSAVNIPDFVPNNCAVSSATIRVRAVWSANRAVISFDSNGGTAVSNKSVSYGDVLVGMPIPTKYGYALVGWYKNVRGAGVCYKDGVVADFNNDGNTPTVTLYARWVAEVYTITFTTIGGVPAPDNITYTVETETFLLPSAYGADSLNTYWRDTGDDNNYIREIPQGTIGNKALDSESPITVTGANIGHSVSVLDLTNKTETLNTIYTVENSTNVLIIKGDVNKTYRNVNFRIASRSNILYMTLSNFTFYAYDNNNAIWSEDASAVTLRKMNGDRYGVDLRGGCDIVLVADGSSGVYGGRRTEKTLADLASSKPEKYCAGIVCSWLTITEVQSSTLVINGGNGTNGGNYSSDSLVRDGNPGGVGICVHYVIIDITNLTVIGGNGGNGGQGVQGDGGSTNNDGGTGGKGGRGGDGKKAIFAFHQIHIIRWQEINICGGTGGNGGKGGTGGTGGNGQDGFTKAKPGGDGGTGGKGGDGGDGSIASFTNRYTLEIENEAANLVAALYLASGSDGGKGGSGGSGGEGGRGGKIVGSVRKSNGDSGCGGASGNDGAKGK